MTPAEVETAARRRYNAVNSNFFSQAEVFNIIYEGEMVLAQEGFVIEDKDTSVSTVAGTRNYSVPSGTLAIERVEYDGNKLEPITFREDDRLTLSNSATTEQGNSQYYTLFNDEILLRPIPDAVKTLTIYRNKVPTALTTASTTLSVPTYCHTYLIDYVCMIMALKDMQKDVAQMYEARWERGVQKIKQMARKVKRKDAFAYVKDEDDLSNSIIGTV